MKARFITNGVLALIILIGYILIFVAVANLSGDGTVKTTTTDVWGHSQTTYTSGSITDAASALAGIAMVAIASLVSFIMGIITLAMIGQANQRGLGIASGIIAILGGLFGVNAIVSFIGAAKENK